MFWLSGGTFCSNSAAGPFNARTSETALSFSVQLFAHAAASNWRRYVAPVSYTHLDVYKRQANTLSRVNVKDQTYKGEKDTIIKIYHIILLRAEMTWPIS